jgi:glucose/arabinose dehydrogenase
MFYFVSDSTLSYRKSISDDPEQYSLSECPISKGHYTCSYADSDGVTFGSKVVNGMALDDSDPLNKYFAYGMKNSFGIGFDPIAGNLWDTENGPTYVDEINLVKYGFNSG